MTDEWINDEGWQPRFEPAWSSLVLCDICRGMLTEFFLNFWQMSHYNHHSSQEDVLEAAEKRCYICRLLRNQWSEPGFRFPLPEQLEIATSLRFWCDHTIGSRDRLTFFCGYVASNRTEILTLTIKNLFDATQLSTSYPEQSTWSATNIEKAKQWLRGHSADDHLRDSTTFLPKRLLHVQALNDNLYQVKLCEGSTISPGAQYLRLSHCWGNIDFVRLKENNVNKFKTGIEYQSLTKTFRDAIRVTCDLGFQYLWIDSFCIIQDSQKDWLSQGSIMGLIYQNAACNLSADAAQNGDEGLIRTRDIDTFLPLRLDILLPNTRGRNSEQYCLLIHESWKDAVWDAPLGKRAWVLQERLLSRKIIHFTTRQLFFESKDSRHEADNCSEQWPSGVSRHFSRGPKTDEGVQWWNKVTGISSEERWVSWIHLVEKYSQMRLTYDTDRLAALSGAVKEVQSQSGDEYLAGIWKEDLPYQLLWHNTHPQSWPRTQLYTAPTWSWASTGSAVSYVFRPDIWSNHELLAKFVEAQTSPKLDQDDTGAIKDGFLRLRGSLRQAWLNQGSHKADQKTFWTIGGSRKRIYFLPDDLCLGRTIETVNTAECRKRLYRLFEYIEEMNFNPQSTITVYIPTQSVFLLPILSAFPPHRWSHTDFITVGLTLIPTDKGRGQFQRVGLFFTTHKSELGSILHLPSVIEKCYYEKKNRGRYTISIV